MPILSSTLVRSCLAVRRAAFFRPVKVFAGAAVALFFAAAVQAQTGTALVRHAANIDGRVEGSVQQMLGENLFLNDRDAVVSGDLLVPGTPTVVTRGRLHYGGTLDGAGSASPSNYQIVLGAGLSLGHVARRTDPVVLPVVVQPPAPSGTRTVTLRFRGQNAGDFSTLKNLTVQDDVGAVVLPPGTYGNFTANDDSAFVLGVAGASGPAVYNFQNLVLNGSSRLRVVGPVVVNLANGLSLNRDRDRRRWHQDRHERFRFDADDDYDVAVGSVVHPEWLVLNIAAGGLRLDQNDSLQGYVNAPSGFVSMEDHSSLVGGIIADRLSINDRSRVRLLAVSIPPPPVNQAPAVSVTAPVDGATALALGSITLKATATDSDGTIAKVDFYQNGTLLGTSTVSPYQYAWSTLAGGSYTLTAKATDNLGASTVSAPVVFTVNKIPATIALGALHKIYDGGAQNVNVSSVPVDVPMVITYNGSTELPVNAGSYDVVATVTSLYYFGSETAIMDIAQATPQVTWVSPAAIVYGTPLSSAQLNATSNVPGTFAYSPDAGTVLSAGNAQSLSVSFAPTDSLNFSSVGATTTINVGKAPATVMLGALSRTYDGMPKSVSFTTDPANLPVVVTYDGLGAAPMTAGDHAVVVTVNDANYAGSATGTLTIIKATPVLVWNAPADIVYGTALSATQLNATANTSGAFVYTPAAGTILGAGAGQVLSAAFTPTDTVNYTTASATTTINVLAPVAATIAFDGVSSASILTASTTLTWSHTLTADTGSSRVLIVGVITRGSSVANASVANVKFNGVPMISLDASIANAGSGTFNRSQQFYLFDAALPAAGTYPVLVTFGTSQSTSNSPSGGAISLTNVSQAAPAGLSNSSGVVNANNISTTVTPISAGSWVVDIVGVGSTAANLLTTTAGMVTRFTIPQPGPSTGAAGSTQVAGAGGAVTMSWKNSTARVVQSLAVFTPTLSIPTPPIITTQPVAQTVNVAANVSFTVAATGTSPLTYQWSKDGSPILGATSLTLALTNVQTGAAGSYTVKVSNSLGSATSAPALLTVNQLPPVITTQPLSQTVNLGDSTTLTVVATGTAPFTYQWYKDSSPIGGATASTLSLTNVQAGDGGNYYVTVTNVVTTVPSDTAVLTVNTAPVAPVITKQPASQSAGVGSNVSFSVTVTGTAPLFYQWQKNGVAIPSANAATFTLSNVQLGDAGSYQVVVSNIADDITSLPAVLTVNSLTSPSAMYNLTGFAMLGSGTTGGGVIPDTDAAYRKVYTALDLAQAIKDSKTVGVVKVIEIMNDLNLGWNEIDAAVKSLASTPFRSHAAPKLHPTLIATGVSLIDIQSKPGLTIFSANGATIKHATFNFKGTSNIIVRNLRFDEMWEWDEASKGDYDSNDWDFIDLSNGTAVTNVWIDHCTFTKAYDGIVDMKAGTQYVTMSWCHYVGDDGATNLNSSVRQQINALEANKAAYPFYNFLRTNGFSVEDIVQIIQGHDKCHLMGSNSLDANNATLSATFHHQLFQDIWDRCVPRLRAGQVHNYNIFVDDSLGLVAKRLRDLRANAMSASAKTTLNSTYSFNPFLNGSISTEGGAILVEKSVYQDCLTPLRNNQTDITNPLYTGKIRSVDSIYIFHEADSTVTIQRGDSTDAGSRMGPNQAPIIPFSWNTSDGSRPYPAPVMDDPADLEVIVSTGAGAGKISWSKDNWLKITY